MDEFKWNNDEFKNEDIILNEDEEIIEPVFIDERPKKSKRKFGMGTLALCVVLTMIISVSGYALVNPVIENFVENTKNRTITMEKTPTPDKSATASPMVKTEAGEKMEIPDIADKVGPAVVGVINKTTYSNSFPYSYYYPGYYQDNTQTEIQQGSGSGIIISEDGYVVTNQHVVEGATSLSVILSTGQEYTATLKGSDARTDLALLKIEGENFPYATFGDSSVLRVGELCVAIGNPLGQELAGTVTVGYISALNRSVTIDNKTLTLIQTDAAINPGNSGGALVNQYGQVIGINTAKISSSNLEGLGFAIPTSEATPIISDLMKSGYVKGRPVIGISGSAITKQQAERYNLVEGVYVYSMSVNSPANLAGIKVGDIVVECEGKKVTTVDELNDIKNKYKPGDTIKLKVYRGGKYVDIALILAEEMPQ